MSGRHGAGSAGCLASTLDRAPANNGSQPLVGFFKRYRPFSRSQLVGEGVSVSVRVHMCVTRELAMDCSTLVVFCRLHADCLPDSPVTVQLDSPLSFFGGRRASDKVKLLGERTDTLPWSGRAPPRIPAHAWRERSLSPQAPSWTLKGSLGRNLFLSQTLATRLRL